MRRRLERRSSMSRCTSSVASAARTRPCHFRRLGVRDQLRPSARAQAKSLSERAYGPRARSSHRSVTGSYRCGCVCRRLTGSWLLRSLWWWWRGWSRLCRMRRWRLRRQRRRAPRRLPASALRSGISSRALFTSLRVSLMSLSGPPAAKGSVSQESEDAVKPLGGSARWRRRDCQDKGGVRGPCWSHGLRWPPTSRRTLRKTR